MSKQFGAALEKIKGLRTELFRAHSSFRAFEVIQEMRAPNIIGDAEASRNAKAMGSFKGFFNVTEHALNTEFLVAMAKLYDDHKGGTSIPKLIDYIRGNIKNFKLKDFVEHNKERADIEDRRLDYKEVTLGGLAEIEDELNELSVEIGKLKVLRDKRIAHLEMKNLEELQNEEEPKDLELSQTKFNDLTYEEIATLITTADLLLNKISSLINKDVAYFEPLKETVTEDSEHIINVVRTVYDTMSSGN